MFFDRNSTYGCTQTVVLVLKTPPPLFIFHLKAILFSNPALIFPWIAMFFSPLCGSFARLKTLNSNGIVGGLKPGQSKTRIPGPIP